MRFYAVPRVNPQAYRPALSLPLQYQAREAIAETLLNLPERFVRSMLTFERRCRYDRGKMRVAIPLVGDFADPTIGIDHATILVGMHLGAANMMQRGDALKIVESPRLRQQSAMQDVIVNRLVAAEAIRRDVGQA